MVKTSRFKEMQDHSLRLSDVNQIKRKVEDYSRKLLNEPHYGKELAIVKGGLGDPTEFGFREPERLKEILGGVVRSERPHYTNSIGYPEFLEEISYGGLHLIERPNGEKRVEHSYKLERGKDAFIFVGSGSSGVVRSYMQMVGGGKKHRAVVFIPELTYPLFLAEAANIEGDVITVPLNRESGVVDCGELERKMIETIRKYGTQVRYILAITTIGNPLGSAMSAETFDEITALLKRINTKFGIRVHRITDPTYEPFRRNQAERFDPVERIIATDSSAIELVTGTFSKSQCWTGKRVGYGIVLVNGVKNILEKFRQKLEGLKNRIFEHVDVYHAITLCTVDVHNQMALARWLNEIRTDPNAFVKEQQRQAEMRKEVNERVEYFAHNIAKNDIAWLHSYYYPKGEDGPEKHNGPDLNKLNSFYVLWRFKFERQKLSQAALFAEWTLQRALSEIEKYGEQRTPVVFMNDGDMFFAKTYRGNVPNYIRTVALMDKSTADVVLNLISQAAISITG